jgi:calcineurin-like phosphoesterase family protein
MGDERFDRIIIPVGNDFFNSDGAKGETTKGTPQDEDGRFGKCFEYGLDLYVEIVETMRRFTDSVEVVLVPGNHDRNASMMLSHAIKAYFRLCGDVRVDTVQMPRKYIEFGKVLLSLGHYDEDGRFPERLIANEASEAWGRTKYREAHGAHLHQEMVKEVGGVKFRRAPSIVVPSEWAHYKGYGCLQEHICYIYDYDKGLATTWHQTV